VPNGGSVEGSIGVIAGGTIGQIRGAQIGRKSIELEHTASW
jgi:hypothetical protein